jgi:hypothetical protein
MIFKGTNYPKKAFPPKFWESRVLPMMREGNGFF